MLWHNFTDAVCPLNGDDILVVRDNLFEPQVQDFFWLFYSIAINVIEARSLKSEAPKIVFSLRVSFLRASRFILLHKDEGRTQDFILNPYSFSKPLQKGSFASAQIADQAQDQGLLI